MSRLPMMPLFVDAYLADTTHLTAEESGAYLHLLMAMWRRNGEIPDDDDDLARISRVAPKRWSRVKQRIMPFLTINAAGELTQKRLTHEWNYANGKVEIQREKGALGGRPRKRSESQNGESDNAKSESQNGESDTASFFSEINELAKANGFCGENPNETQTKPSHPYIPDKKVRKEEASSSLKEYAFSHGCIHLTEKDLLSWVRAYPHISVEGELFAMEGWLASRAGKGWFFAAKNRLAKIEREQAVALAKATAEGAANGNGGYRYRDPSEGF
jgi:uncharacterized protein YdaU (DUF1376 family)